MLQKIREQSVFRHIIVIAVILFLLAHSFAITNLIQNGESLSVNLRDTTMSEITKGNWLRPFYYALRSSIAIPYWNGILSCIYITGFLLVFSVLFGLETISVILLAAGIIILNPAVIAGIAAEIHAVDSSFLSLLLSAAAYGFLLSQYRLRYLLSFCCMVAAVALDFTLSTVPIVMLLIIYADRELHRVSLPKRFGISSLLIWFSAILCSMAALLILSRRYDLKLAFTYIPNRLTVFHTLQRVWQSYIPQFNAYPHVSFVALLFLLFCLPCCIAYQCKVSVRLLICLVFAVIVNPILSIVPLVILDRTPQYCLSYYMPWLLICSIINLQGNWYKHHRELRVTGLLLCLVCFLGQVVFANQVYLKKALEFHSTLSIMTRVVDRLEETDGFVPGETQVAVFGNLDQSPLSVSHEGFEKLERFEAASNHVSIRNDSQSTAYIWQIMGYPLNLVSNFEKKQIKKELDWSSIPVFPADGSVLWWKDTLIVRLSK